MPSSLARPSLKARANVVGEAVWERADEVLVPDYLGGIVPQRIEHELTLPSEPSGPRGISNAGSLVAPNLLGAGHHTKRLVNNLNEKKRASLLPVEPMDVGIQNVNGADLVPLSKLGHVRKTLTVERSRGLLEVQPGARGG